MGHMVVLGFPDGSVGEESACNAGDTGDMSSILGSGRSPGGGNGYPFWYSCLENSMEEEPGKFHRVTNSWIQLKRLNMHTCGSGEQG